MPDASPVDKAAEESIPSTERDAVCDKRLEVLFLYTHPLPEVETILDHVAALTAGSRHRVRPVNMIGELPPRLDLNRFDVIVIHYSIVICLSNHLCRESFERIRAAAPVKVVFIQDEYRHVNATVNAIRGLGIDILFTCVPELEIEKVYPAAKLQGVRKVNVLTGYVSAGLLKLGRPVRLKGRPIDVGYRARRLSAWYGELGREKWMIGNRFAEDAAQFDLQCDISSREKDRLYGADWDAFLHNCRAVLGVESGASVFDFTGDIQSQVEAAEAANPAQSHEELEQQFFPKLEGQIRLNQISPRCFEAAARGTLMILYEGDYSGRMQPGRHYVALKKDHSNMAEVIQTLQDDTKAQAIADRAWGEVAKAHDNSYEAFTALVDDVLTEEWENRSGCQSAPYTDSGFNQASARSWASRLVFLKRHTGRHYPFLKTVWSFFRRMINPQFNQTKRN